MTKTKLLSTTTISTTNDKSQLTTFVKTLLRASRKDDKKSSVDSKALRPFIINWLNSEKSEQGWDMESIRIALYKMAEYDSKAIDSKGESLKSMAFETRCGRSIKDALLQYKNVNPIRQIEVTDDKGNTISEDNFFDDATNGYQVDKGGDLTLPHNVLLPTITTEIDGVKQDLPNNDTARIKVVARLRENHFAKVFVGVSKRTPHNNEDKYLAMATDLNKFLKTLSSGAVLNMAELKYNTYKELENTLYTMGEKRAVAESVEIDNEVREA